MNWLSNLLSNLYPEQSVAWLLITSILATVFGVISSYVTYHFIKHKEIIDSVIADIQKKNIFLTIESENARKERNRTEVTRWANPILGAVQDLEAKLRNILEDGGYLALNQDYRENVNPRWSISYDYFMHSSLYVFAQYFCWIRMLQENLNFELFQTRQDRSDFFDAIEAVNDALGGFPPYYGPGDRQIFRLQQRAIGEQMIIKNDNEKRCLSYPDFIKKYDEDESFRKNIDPLRSILENLDPSIAGRWERLINTQKQLGKLNNACNELLSI
jgi:hypothetical protein